MERNLQNFIENHENDDLNALILQKDRYPDVDIVTAAKCIHGRQVVKNKVPSWYRVPTLLYPSSLPLEQCSSEAAAIYKQRFVPDGGRIADFTGGLGVDCYFMSLKATSASYFERNGELATIAAHNFLELGNSNIVVMEKEVSLETLSGIPDDTYGLIYMDPARRGKTGERLFSIRDCEPDITGMKTELLRIAERVLVKLSPMADISAICREVPETAEIHVIASGNECKELLLLLRRDADRERTDPRICTVDLEAGYTLEFLPSEEREAKAVFAQTGDIRPGAWLCEPCRAVLKAGAFKLLSERFGVLKIAPDTHYYISSGIPSGFPGKVRRIIAVYRFDKNFMKNFRSEYPYCSVTSRNFPIASEALKKKLKTQESDRYRLLATTAASGERIAVLTEPIQRTSD